jgi:hypothetical protein
VLNPETLRMAVVVMDAMAANQKQWAELLAKDKSN